MGSETVSGVYAITHLASGRAYIGSSKDVMGRLANHQKTLREGRHVNQYLQRAYVKHGKSEFDFSPLEWCEASVRVDREQFWIDQLQAANKEFGFNLSPEATNGFASPLCRERMVAANKSRKGTTWKASDPEAWKSKISASRTGKIYGPRNPEVGKKIAASLKGKPLSEERKAKISAAHKGKKRGPHSEEHKRNLSLAHQGKKQHPDVKAMMKENHWTRDPIKLAKGIAKQKATKALWSDERKVEYRKKISETLLKGKGNG